MQETNSTTCCIVGGGPAGIFLGYLLARSGIRVTILEKHADFLRDFRGDTIHPSTMTLLDELGLLDDFLPLIDYRTNQPLVSINGRIFPGPTLRRLDVKCPFIGFTPQWEFLNLLSQHGNKLPSFDLRMRTKATDVLREQGKVVGVRCESGGETYEIKADLVVAADGRSSTLRSATDHRIVEQGIPIDVLWFRLDRPQQDDGHTLGWFDSGRMLVTIPRRDHYQVAMIIRKGSFSNIQADGLDAFRQNVGAVCPPLAGVAVELRSWDDVKLLTVQINRLVNWHEPGLLFIGDAAHAMSPVGGVGINLAIQDAVATANLLVGPIRNRTLTDDDLAKVQRRREPAARKTQRLQQFIHANLFGKPQTAGKPVSLPWYGRWALKLLAPLLRRLMGRWIGIGFQPEHIETLPAKT